MKYAIGLLLVLFSVGSHAYNKVQMPFPEGRMYECTQNSDDFPSHGRNEDGTVNSAAYTSTTKYDLDFGAPTGTLIVAAMTGVVEVAKKSCSTNGALTGSSSQCGSGFGNHIKIGHYGGYSTLYAHLMKNGILVEVGDYVLEGQPIGFTGNSGRSSESHLHFGMHNHGDGIEDSLRVEIFAKQRNHDSFYTIDWFSTGLEDETEFTCQNPSDNPGAVGYTYGRSNLQSESAFSEFECHALGSDEASEGIICWNGYATGTLPICENGESSIRYYKENGVFKSQPDLSQSQKDSYCPNLRGTVDLSNIPGWLEGTSGVGGGSGGGGENQTPQANFTWTDLKLKNELGITTNVIQNTETGEINFSFEVDNDGSYEFSGHAYTCVWHSEGNNIDDEPNLMGCDDFDHDDIGPDQDVDADENFYPPTEIKQHNLVACIHESEPDDDEFDDALDCSARFHFNVVEGSFGNSSNQTCGNLTQKQCSAIMGVIKNYLLD